MNREVETAERVVMLLEAGSFSATYKQAVLVGLMDLCIAHCSARGSPPTSVTTRQLAGRVIELYWPHTLRWADNQDERVLIQNGAARGGRARAKIVRLVQEFRQKVELLDAYAPSLEKGRRHQQKAYEKLVRNIEWTLIEMPLPKLQRVGGQETAWLYRINWDDKRNAPTLSTIRAYQRGEQVGFDNQIRFQPGVAEAFARMAGILRPFVLQHWAAKIAALNDLPEAKLSDFLFGVDRSSLARVRQPLVELQESKCFYCGKRMTGSADVDHFIPWARQPDNGLHNLVAAHPKCNNAKRDFLADSAHIGRWRARAGLKAHALSAIAAETAWELGDVRVLGVARSLYLGLPEDARLWSKRGEFEVADRPVLLETLTA